MKFLNKQSCSHTLKKKIIKSKTNYFYINFFLCYKLYNLRLNFYHYLTNIIYSTSIIRKDYLLVKSKKSVIHLGYNLKNGNYYQNYIKMNLSFSKIYNLIINNKHNLETMDYKYHKEFLYNFYKYKNYNNYTFILNWIFSFIQPMFYIDCMAVPKKYKKKLKKKYLYKVKYLNKTKRINKALKLINNYSNSLKYFNFSDRIFFTYLDLILNYKNSYIFNKKLIIYKKIFKI